MKVVSIWEGPEIFIIWADVAKRQVMHPSRRVDRDRIQSRAQKKKVRTNTAFEKAKNRILEGMTDDKGAAINEEKDENSEEQLRANQRTPLSSQPTTSLSPCLDLKLKYRPTIAASSHRPNSLTLTDIKPAQSTDTLISPLMSPHPFDIDPFAADDDSVSSEDSIF